MPTFKMVQLLSKFNKPGQDLLMTQFGQQAFPELQKELTSVPEGSALTLNFDHIRVIDSSFARETIIKLALGLESSEYGERFMILESLSPVAKDNVEAAISRVIPKNALLVRYEQQLSFIGHIERNLEEAWKLAQVSGAITARDLANKLNLEINAASMRLRKLHAARMLTRREEIDSAGRQHIYTLPE